MEQTRMCDNPLPIGAGVSCDGDPVQNISCTNNDPCPGIAYLQHAVEELIVRLLSQLVEQCSVCCFVVYLINS